MVEQAHVYSRLSHALNGKAIVRKSLLEPMYLRIRKLFYILCVCVCVYVYVCM